MTRVWRPSDNDVWRIDLGPQSSQHEKDLVLEVLKTFVLEKNKTLKVYVPNDHWSKLYLDSLLDYKNTSLIRLYMSKTFNFPPYYNDILGLLIANKVTGHPVYGNDMCIENAMYISPFSDPDEARGLGNTMMNELEDWAKEKKCKFIVTSCFADRQAKLISRWYKSKGYDACEHTFIKTID